MAELGSIKTVDINKYVDPARADFAGALTTALGVGKKIAGEVISANVETDLNQVLGEAAASQVPEIIDPRDTNSQVTEIEATIDMLNQRIAQGRTPSKVEAAKLKLQTITASAMAKHGAFAEQIARRAGIAVDKSGVLTELKLQEAASAQAAVAAQSNLDDISERWKLLGIPREKFATPEGYRLYNERSEVKSATDANTLNHALIIGNRELDADALAASWQVQSNTAQGQFAVSLGEVINRKDGMAAVMAEALKPEGVRNNAMIDNYLSVGRQADAQQVQMLMFGYQQVANEPLLRDPNLRNTAAGKAYMDQTKEMMTYLGTLTEMFSSDTPPTPGAMQLAVLNMNHRMLKRVNTAVPATRALLDLVSTSGIVNGTNLIKLIELDVGGSHNLLQDQIGKTAIGGLSSLLIGATENGGDGISALERTNRWLAVDGEGTLTPEMSPASMNLQMDNILMQSKNPLFTSNLKEDELIRESVAYVEESKRKWGAVEQISTLSPPEYAAKHLSVLNNSFRILLKVGNPGKQQIQWTQDSLADPELFQALQTAGDDIGKNYRYAFGSTVRDLYAQTQPGDLRSAAMAELDSRVINGTLRSFAKIDLDRIADEGIVTYEIDTDRIKQAAEKSLEHRRNQNEYSSEQQDYNNAVTRLTNEVRNRMDRLVSFASKDIRASAHIEAADAPLIEGDYKPRYLVEANKLGWIQGLLQ